MRHRLKCKNFHLRVIIEVTNLCHYLNSNKLNNFLPLKLQIRKMLTLIKIYR